jgi:hypothetical protein
MPRYLAVLKMNLLDRPHSIELHRVAIPWMDEKGSYRQSVSLNCFFHNANPKKRHNWRKGAGVSTLFTCEDWGIYEMWWRGNPGGLGSPVDPKNITKTHDSIWAFYEHVGFDYKAKKWIETPLSSENHSSGL